VDNIIAQNIGLKKKKHTHTHTQGNVKQMRYVSKRILQFNNMFTLSPTLNIICITCYTNYTHEHIASHVIRNIICHSVNTCNT
jgi:hypothetical protein